MYLTCLSGVFFKNRVILKSLDLTSGGFIIVSDLFVRYFKMCFCDGYNFLIINKNSGEKYFIEGDENLVEFFEWVITRYRVYSTDC